MTNSLEMQKQAKRYFIIVTGLSVLWILLFILSQPDWVQKIKENLGLSPVLIATEDSFYNSRIDPIFEKHCVACHDGNKDKGQLRLDSFRQLTFGGKTNTDLTQAKHNLLIERMELPEEDRMAMPPYGRDRQTESEMTLLKMWLAKGGSRELTEADFPEAPAKAKVIKFLDIDWQAIKLERATFEASVNQLKQTYPNLLHYQAKTSALLILNSFSMKRDFSDKHLQDFSEISSVITELHLAGSNITDKSIALILSMKKLTTINIVGTNISNKALLKLTALGSLRKIIVNEDLINKADKAKFIQKDIKLINVKQG